MEFALVDHILRLIDMIHSLLVLTGRSERAWQDINEYYKEVYSMVFPTYSENTPKPPIFEILAADFRMLVEMNEQEPRPSGQRPLGSTRVQTRW